MNARPVTNDQLSRALQKATGQEYWRSLDELAQTPEFLEYLHREFPVGASEWRDDVSRRTFIKMMAASFALAGLTGCTSQAREKIIPYVQQPEDIVPGRPLFFATAMEMNGYGIGVLAESHMGRPTKIEGNPGHPMSLGATMAFQQSDLLMLYDPDRSKRILRGKRPSTWASFQQDLLAVLREERPGGGAGIRLLTGRVTSPTLAWQIAEFRRNFPNAQWHHWDPLHEDEQRRAALMAFGRDLRPYYRIGRAKVIVSIDSDFLGSGPQQLRHAREWSDQRRARHESAEMNRVYMLESTPTITGAAADHCLAVRPSQLDAHARALASRLNMEVGSSGNVATWIEAAAHDLEAHRGECLVIAGEQAPAHVQALCYAMNEQLGNIGNTVHFMQPAEDSPEDYSESLSRLVEEMNAEEVRALIMIGVNPVYDAPANVQFAHALQKVPVRVHHGLYVDETAQQSTWHIPAVHMLEDWSDIRAAEGTTSIIQPLITPLYGGHSAHELLATMIDPASITTAYDCVRRYWRDVDARAGNEFERFWRTSVHDGIVKDSAAKPEDAIIGSGFIRELPELSTESGLEVIFRADPSVHDGKYSNIGWQQELPKPLTKLVWDNAVLVSEATARDFNVKRGQMVRLHLRERSVEAPIWITPGHVDGAATLTFGYGRAFAGNIANGIGFNAYTLRTSDAPWSGAGLRIEPLDKQYELVATQDHHSMAGRQMVVAATAQEFRAHPHEVVSHDHGHEQHSFYPAETEDRYEWGMAIELSTCIGCNACVVACQAENNIPIVGKREVSNGREMHWIRIDRYYRGASSTPEVFFQPVPCMHCEKAPCEVVCPVAATSHSDEGLNEMTYNRCVGTRYCSNNCPYKVRRFNFLAYNAVDDPAIAASKNPDVTVRARGVMEKCTYCVQRINEARRDAKRTGGMIEDGALQTACQQVCPTRSIIFGNIADAGALVSSMKSEPHNYALLAELNTQPRTTYLACIRNPGEAGH